MKNTLVILLASLVTLGHSQTAIPFTSPKWRFEGESHKIENYQGKESLVLNKSRGFFETQFENGVIEYDVAFPQARAFIGVMFRVQDDMNYEEFYLRSHQSGNPDANQYSPVYNGVSGWQLYYGEGYGVPVKYQFDTWQHVKLAIQGKYMDVYINDMDKPVMFCELKREQKPGYVGLSNGINESHFANFTLTPSNEIKLKGTPKPKAEPAPGTITSWQVSEPFSDKLLTNSIDLKPVNVTKWYTSDVEPTGTTNIARLVKFSPEANTVLVKVSVNSDATQIRKFTFGFSDRVKVFCNNAILFSGEDEFLSRDYRYLGTIGYFDAVYLPLKKGKNDIVFAVTETFGGWGLKGKFDDMTGITVVK